MKIRDFVDCAMKVTPVLSLLLFEAMVSTGFLQEDADTVVCMRNSYDRGPFDRGPYDRGSYVRGSYDRGSYNRGSSEFCQLKPRRYDIIDLGSDAYFHGWVDVQGQGVANDYCRVVGNPPNGAAMLSCALAGTHGCSENNYNSVKRGFDFGHKDTWYMRDKDNDGRDDYCRCVGPTGNKPSQVVCTKAGPKGFYGSAEQGFETNTFTLLGTNNCENKLVRPEFGEEYTVP